MIWFVEKCDLLSSCDSHCPCFCTCCSRPTLSHYKPCWANADSDAYSCVIMCSISLEWRHNELDGVSIHRRLDCFLNRLFRRRSKKTSKLRVIGLCEGNPPVTGGFPSQRTGNAENVAIWWHHYDGGISCLRRCNAEFTRQKCVVNKSAYLVKSTLIFTLNGSTERYLG